MRIVIISGLSGSGKSIALNMLEDAGYYCVDNIPSEILLSMVELLKSRGYTKVAAAIDIRGGESISLLPQQIKALEQVKEYELYFIFLTAKDETLIKRYSEARRRHPLVDADNTLTEAIDKERGRLEGLSDLGHHIDTSDLHPNTLREWIRQLVLPQADSGQRLTLLFVSFGFKHGVPLDAELVFDVRCLPNPFYDTTLRPLTGLDQAVINFLEFEPEVIRMRNDIVRFVGDWLPTYMRDNRSYLTVGIGCTGGQHRSVYLAQWLGHYFAEKARVLIRHRELPFPNRRGNP